MFDEDDGTLDGIESGAIQVTVVQKPFMFGYLASKWMHELATKGEAAKAAIPPNHRIDTGVDLIDKSNVAGFKAKRGGVDGRTAVEADRRDWGTAAIHEELAIHVRVALEQHQHEFGLVVHSDDAAALH